MYSSSLPSATTPSFWVASLHAVINWAYASPSKSPGTSPLASSVLIRSRNAVSITLPSSMMKQIFSPLVPDRSSTFRRSSSKSSAV